MINMIRTPNRASAISTMSTLFFHNSRDVFGHMMAFGLSLSSSTIATNCSDRFWICLIPSHRVLFHWPWISGIACAFSRFLFFGIFLVAFMVNFNYTLWMSTTPSVNGSLFLLRIFGISLTGKRVFMRFFFRTSRSFGLAFLFWRSYVFIRHGAPRMRCGQNGVGVLSTGAVCSL